MAAMCAVAVGEVKKIVDESFATGRFVSGWEQVQEVLKKANLAWCAKVQPDFVGTHKGNRSHV